MTDRDGIQRTISWIWLALLITLAYGGALQNDFVWDDAYFFGDYFWVHDFRTALTAAFEPLFGQRSYVRPLPLLTLYAEVIASDRNPALSHAVNLVVHWSCSVLVLLLARRAVSIGDEFNHHRSSWSWMPLLLASLFAVHPALSEAPIWISSRFDLMATFWVLLALWASDLDIRDTPRALLLGSLFFIGALCKESVAVFPFLLGTYALLKDSAARAGGPVQLRAAFSSRDIKAYVALLAAGLVYLVIRHHVMSGVELLENTRPIPVDWFSRITSAISKYLQLTVMPFIGSSPQHHWTWPQNGSLTTYWQAHLLALALLGVAFVLTIKRRPAGWWLLAWLAAYLPVLHLIPIPIGNNVIHQRFMYLPTAILFVFAPYALAHVRISNMARRASIVLAVTIIAVSIPVDRSIVRVWRSDLALWTWTTRTQPESVEARENLVWAYLKNDMYEEAEKEFLHIVKNKMPTSPIIAINMGTAMYRQDEFEGALHYYAKAEERQTTLSRTFRSRLFSNIGITNAVLGNADIAKIYLLQAIDENNRNLSAIGHLLGYCQGMDVDTSSFDKKDIELAQNAIKDTHLLLQKHQPELHSQRAFCPSLQ